MTPINITKHEVLGLAVSGRELYKLIGHSQASRDVFGDWFNDRMKRFDLVSGKDYIRTEVDSPNNPSSKRKSFEYIVTLEATEQIATFQLAKRGMGVLDYIKEYKRTEGKIATVLLPAQLTTDAATAHSATSAISVLSDATQPKINFDKALPEMEKLGPPNQPSQLPAFTLPVSPLSDKQRTSTATSEQPLSLVQQLLQQAQQLADEEAKRDQIPNELFVAFDNRLKGIESKLNAVVFFFQQSANVLSNIVPVQSGVESTPPVGPPTHEQTIRAKIVRLVDAWVITAKTTHKETWRYLYASLLQKTRFDVYAHGAGQKESIFLDIIEERGQLENLYTIADVTLRPKL